MSNVDSKEKKIPNVPNLGFTDAIWKRYKISDLCNVIGGGTPSTSEPSFWDGELQWFTPTEIGKTKYVQNSARTITQKGYKASSAKMLPVGTVLLTTRATIGDASIALKECCTNQGFQSLVAKNDNDNEFLYYLIQTKRKELKTKANGSTFIEISNQEVRKINVMVPDSKTQTKIAKFLSLIDKRIETQNKIINNLISQKKYLKSIIFNNTKSNHQIGDFLIEYTEKNVNNYEPVSVGKYGIRKRTEVFSRELSEDYSKNKVIHKDTLTIGMGTKEIDIAVLFEDSCYCVSPAYATYKIKNIDSYYFNELLDNFNYLLSLRYMISGARQGKSVNKKELMNHQIFVHTQEQQIVIKNLLKSVDNKINNETKLLEKYSQQKNYLLDNLFI